MFHATAGTNRRRQLLSDPPLLTDFVNSKAAFGVVFHYDLDIVSGLPTPRASFFSLAFDDQVCSCHSNVGLRIYSGGDRSTQGH